MKKNEVKDDLTISDVIYFRRTLMIRVLLPTTNEAYHSAEIKDNRTSFVCVSHTRSTSGYDNVKNVQIKNSLQLFFQDVQLQKPQLLQFCLKLRTNLRSIDLPLTDSLLSGKVLSKRFQQLVSGYPGDSHANFLEIGSRSRSGNIYKEQFADFVDYTGLDVVPGENVDVVGDAHYLTNYFPQNSFDFAYSISTFEHLFCPWVAAIQLNKVLKVGGKAYIQSHQTWPVHEEPADYFRFSKHSWASLFNRMTGFAVVDCAQEVPAYILPARFDLHGRKPQFDYELGYMMSCCIIEKTSECLVDWNLNNVPISELTGLYPE